MLKRFSLVVLLAAVAQTAQAAEPVVVLGAQTLFRTHVTYRPQIFGTAAAAKEEPKETNRYISRLNEVLSPWPDADWGSVGYDDSGWSRRTPTQTAGPDGFGAEVDPHMALIALRDRFGVSDPAAVQDLTLKLTYRGGVVVCLNGREIARQDLPAGALKPETLATDYPEAAYMAPGGEARLPALSPREKAKPEVLERYALRNRKLSVAIPPTALQKGVNLLTLEIHRTALPENLPGGNRGQGWAPIGLADLALTTTSPAVQANTPAAGVQVWAADPHQRFEGGVLYGDPFDPPAVVRLQAPRNGIASGQVVISNAEGVRGLAATASDLRSAGGATIPAAALRIRYAKVPEAYIALMDEPQDGAAMQPVWVTVKLPAEAPAGRYTGTLTLKGLAKPTVVPIELTVFDYRVPDPKDWKTWCNLLESPESVAGYYKVPLWSEAHFKLLEKSFELMADCGNDVLGVSAVAENVFGNDPLVLFKREDGKLVPELKYLDRYLGLYDKIAGEPKFLAVHVWSYGMYYKGYGRDGGTEKKSAETIRVGVVEGDKVVTVEAPMHGKPGAEEMWKAAMEGVKAIVDKRWKHTRILVGTGGDTWPGEDTVQLFKKVAPYAKWRVITHGNGAPKWGLTDQQRTQPNGMVIGYLEIARRLMSFRDYNPEVPVVASSGDHVGSNPYDFRGLAILNDARPNFEGWCWKGLDYWPYTNAAGTKVSALNTYVRFGNLVRSTPRTIALPGPSGAVATAQYEMLREGTQDCEALMYLDAIHKDAARKAKLPAEVVKRMEQVLEDYPNVLQAGTTTGSKGGDVRTQTARLYQAAAAMAGALGDK